MAKTTKNSSKPGKVNSKTGKPAKTQKPKPPVDEEDELITGHEDVDMDKLRRVCEAENETFENAGNLPWPTPKCRYRFEIAAVRIGVKDDPEKGKYGWYALTLNVLEAFKSVGKSWEGGQCTGGWYSVHGKAAFIGKEVLAALGITTTDSFEALMAISQSTGLVFEADVITTEYQGKKRIEFDRATISLVSEGEVEESEEQEEPDESDYEDDEDDDDNDD